MDAAPSSVADYRPLAQARLDPAVWRYLADGEQADDGAALAAQRLYPRPLRDLRGGHTRLELLGQQLAHPILLAPVAYQRLFHPEGEAAAALAASAQDAPFMISSLASQPFAAIAAAARREDGVGPWFQLYWQGNRDASLRLLRRAEEAGCSTVTLTVDAPIKLATLRLPGAVSAVNLETAVPASLVECRPEAGPFDGRRAALCETPVSPAPTFQGSIVFDGWMAQAPKWDDLAWLRRQTRLPLLVKGILHPADALRAVDVGCDGLVVSSHGGRVLAGAPTALHALPAIAEAVAGRVPLLYDSGIRHGRDIFAALALGARAALVGRPCVWGLAAHGAHGVAHVIRLLRDELEMTMALCGCATLGDIGPECLVPARG